MDNSDLLPNTISQNVFYFGKNIVNRYLSRLSYITLAAMQMLHSFLATYCVLN